MSKIQYNKLNTEDFIKKCKNIHGDLYNYTKSEYIGANNYIIIICKKHGEFRQLPSNHYKYGCGKCGREKNKRCKSLKEECKKTFTVKCKNIHGNKYDYSKSEYIDATSKLIVICKIHGEFKISPNNHLGGKGCLKCGRLKSDVSKVKYLDDYSKVEWINASTKITIICKKHGEFNIYPYDHKNGRGCSSCSNQYSKKSIEWLNYISNKLNINIQHAENGGEKYIFSKTKADGYCKENNTIYEFHGDFWHGNPKLYDPNEIHPRNNKKFGELFKRTLHKELMCRNLGYKYECIWESEWK